MITGIVITDKRLQRNSLRKNR